MTRLSEPETLRDRGVKFFRIVWCDNANIIRGKSIHLSALTRFIENGVGVTRAMQAAPVHMDMVSPGSGLAPVGEFWLKPDLESIHILPYTPTHTRAFGDMYVDGDPWSNCPRRFLKRMIARAKEHEINIFAAFEPEFYLFKAGEETLIPSDNNCFAQSMAMDVNHTVINAIADALMEQHVDVEQYYPESGNGQQELTIRYADAQRAADNHIIYRETVHAVAHQHGLRACFVPKVFENQCGNGCHLHLSLSSHGKSLVSGPKDELSEVSCYFIAGILEHLPALMAITTPSTNSYRRVKPHSWVGAYNCWGYDNREAAVRVPTNPIAPHHTHFELKTVDSSANPYLALGAVIAAGLDGIERKLKVPPPIDVDPGDYSDTELKSKKIKLLPQDLLSSLKFLKKDTVLLDALGSSLATAFTATRQAEWDAMHEMSLEEEVKILIDRY